MAKVGDEMVVCLWPNGEEKVVAISDETEHRFHILWNERVKIIPQPDALGSHEYCTKGFDEWVPKTWIQAPR